MEEEKVSRRSFIGKSVGAVAAGAGIQALQGLLQPANSAPVDKSSELRGAGGAGGSSVSQPGTGASGSPASSATGRQSAAAAANYEISQWTGDNFNRGHELRDGYVAKVPR